MYKVTKYRQRKSHQSYTYSAELTCQYIEVISRFPLLNDQLSLSVNLLIHAVHHLPHVLVLQLLQEVIVHDSIVDELLGAGVERRRNKQCQVMSSQFYLYSKLSPITNLS